MQQLLHKKKAMKGVFGHTWVKILVSSFVTIAIILMLRAITIYTYSEMLSAHFETLLIDSCSDRLYKVATELEPLDLGVRKSVSADLDYVFSTQVKLTQGRRRLAFSDVLAAPNSVAQSIMQMNYKVNDYHYATSGPREQASTFERGDLALWVPINEYLSQVKKTAPWAYSYWFEKIHRQLRQLVLEIAQIQNDKDAVKLEYLTNTYLGYREQVLKDFFLAVQDYYHRDPYDMLVEAMYNHKTASVMDSLTFVRNNVFATDNTPSPFRVFLEEAIREDDRYEWQIDSLMTDYFIALDQLDNTNEEKSEPANGTDNEEEKRLRLTARKSGTETSVTVDLSAHKDSIDVVINSLIQLQDGTIPHKPYCVGLDRVVMIANWLENRNERQECSAQRKIVGTQLIYKVMIWAPGLIYVLLFVCALFFYFFVLNFIIYSNRQSKHARKIASILNEDVSVEEQIKLMHEYCLNGDDPYENDDWSTTKSDKGQSSPLPESCDDLCDYFFIMMNEQNADKFQWTNESCHAQLEERVEGKRDRMRQVYVWVIRLGIIGTLMGIGQAFHAMISGFSMGYEGAAFKNALINSINGNAVAVWTSLAAHLMTLFLEIIVGEFVLRLTNPMDAFYRANRSLIGALSPSAIDKQVTSIKTHVNNFGKWVEGVTTSMGSNAIADFNASLSKTTNYLANITIHLENANITGGFLNFSSALDGIVENAQAFGKSVSACSQELQNVETESEALKKSIGDLEESLRGLMSSANTFSSTMAELPDDNDIRQKKDEFNEAVAKFAAIASETSKYDLEGLQQLAYIVRGLTEASEAFCRTLHSSDKK